MKLQVAKWGNSLAIRLPVSHAKLAGIAEGDTLEACVSVGGESHIMSKSHGDPEAVWETVGSFGVHYAAYR